MDRDKALQYFKQLGFTSLPLGLKGQRRFLSPREVVVEGDGLGSRNHWGDDGGDTEPEDKALPQGTHDAWTEFRALLPLTQGEEEVGRGERGPRTAVAISTACTCSRQPRSARSGRSGGRSPESVAVSDARDDAGADSDADSDEEGLSLDQLLMVLERQEERARASGSNSSNSLLRLVTSFSPSQPPSDRHIDKLLWLLGSEQSGVREAVMGVVERVVGGRGGGPVVQRTGLVDTVMDVILDSTQPSPLRLTAMAVLDKMLTRPELDYDQVRPRLDTEIYPSMLQCLHGKESLEVKYAACCVVRSLARDAEFAARIRRESLFLLRELRDASARLKEVYVGVVMALYGHGGLREAGSVDAGVIPVLKGLLRDGPCDSQRQALELLQCVMGEGTGVETVTSDQRMVAYVLACLLTSNCRKVRRQACVAASTLSCLHSVGLVRPLLEAIGHYMGATTTTTTTSPGGGGGGKVTDPVPSRSQAEAVLWHQLDRFLSSVTALLHSEGLISVKGEHPHSLLPVRGEVSEVQLSCLSYLLQLVTNVCLWPLQRRVMGLGHVQLPHLDVTHLCDDMALRQRLSTLNRRLAVQQWQRFGPGVLAVVRWMSERITTRLQQGSRGNTSDAHARDCHSSPSAPASARSGSVQSSSSSPGKSSSTTPLLPLPQASVCRVGREEVLGEEERGVVVAALHFLLCMTLATCRAISDPLTDDTHDNDDDDNALTHTPPKRAGGEGRGLWVKANPHLTQSAGGQPAPSPGDRGQRREGGWDRRRVRRELVNQGLFLLLPRFLTLHDPHVKMLCCLILRTAVQPLEEKSSSSSSSSSSLSRSSVKKAAAHSTSYTAFGPTSHTHTPYNHRRPQSAMASGCSKGDKQTPAVPCTAPSPATPVREAVGSRPPSMCKAASERALTSARRSLSAVRATQDETTSDSDSSQQNISNTSSQSLARLRPLVPSQPVNRQCQREAVRTCGSEVISCLFCPWRRVKLCCLALLYDLVRFTSAPIHMELSKRGIVPKLLDFIRVNEDDDHLEILALRVVSVLMRSDGRLQQLFSHHGGHTLLTAMGRTASPALRPHLTATLATVTKGQRLDGQGQKVRGQRPASAPIKRRESCPANVSSPPRDIWEHIMQRWVQEDRVVKVLQKFMHSPPPTPVASPCTVASPL